jgi:phosphoenolpyruvate carboxylase
MKTNVSRTMSTQHPDNARQPFFTENSIIGGDDEITEAYYVFSHLKSREQLWDIEGKEVDNFVVKKLFAKYENFFRRQVLGRDLFLTIRVPNPEVEKSEAKLMLETLESIPRSHDIARMFYGDDIPPIFELALPMATNAESLVRIAEYYKQYVVKKGESRMFPGDIRIREWCGDFRPENIRVIPLFETKESMLNADRMAQEYIKKEKPADYMRVWLARSDPALTYGSFPTIILLKITLQRLQALEEKTGLPILPILGLGSVPFRGNLKPTNAGTIMEGYPSVQTFTIQSAFKYDYPEEDVRKAVEQMNTTQRGKPKFIDEKKGMAIFNKISAEYQKLIREIAPRINEFSTYVPKRRKRKLHIGLFGYSRATSGVKLPRAIAFCATLYSLGLPPELLGLSAITRKDIDAINVSYKNFESDFREAAQYLNRDNLRIFPASIRKAVESASKLVDFEANREHKILTTQIAEDYSRMNIASMTENIIKAGQLRGFLG